MVDPALDGSDIDGFQSYFQEEDEQIDLRISAIIKIQDSLMYFS